MRSVRISSLFLCLMAVLVVSPAAPLRAQDAVTGDIRCLVIMLQAAHDADADIRQAGAIGSVYYFGRLEGRVTMPDLERLVAESIATMTPDLFAMEKVRCTGMVIERGQLLTDMGDRLAGR
jgi:hypothetical protein